MKLILFSVFLLIAYSALAQQDSLPPPIDIEQLPSNDGRLARVDATPKFPGGEQAMVDYLKKNLRYPDAMRQARVEGAAHVAFTIAASGELENIRVLSGIPEGELLDQEALRVVQEMPRWEPAQVNGVPVPMEYVLPVTFKVTN